MRESSHCPPTYIPSHQRLTVPPVNTSCQHTQSTHPINTSTLRDCSGIIRTRILYILQLHRRGKVLSIQSLRDRYVLFFTHPLITLIKTIPSSTKNHLVIAYLLIPSSHIISAQPTYHPLCHVSSWSYTPYVVLPSQNSTSLNTFYYHTLSPHILSRAFYSCRSCPFVDCMCQRIIFFTRWSVLFRWISLVFRIMFRQHRNF